MYTQPKKIARKASVTFMKIHCKAWNNDAEIYNVLNYTPSLKSSIIFQGVFNILAKVVTLDVHNTFGWIYITGHILHRRF